MLKKIAVLDTLRDLLFTLKSPETALRLQQVREAAGNDMLKNMQLVFPACAKIQMEVVAKHGYKGDGEGVQWPSSSNFFLSSSYYRFQGFCILWSKWRNWSRVTPRCCSWAKNSRPSSFRQSDSQWRHHERDKSSHLFRAFSISIGNMGCS